MTGRADQEMGPRGAERGQPGDKGGRGGQWRLVQSKGIDNGGAREFFLI